MPGIFTTNGMHLRIPAGGLRIPLDGSAPPPVVVEVGLDTWDHWLAIARDHTRAAEAAHEQLLRVRGQDDSNAKARVLEAEFRSGMQAISAQAFAVDAFYAAVMERLPKRPRERSSGQATRYKWVAETLRRATKLDDEQFARVRDFLAQLFKFRDWAVHPPAEFSQPIEHEDLQVGVEWRFVAFSAKNARTFQNGSEDLLIGGLDRIRPGLPELEEWASGLKNRLAETCE